MNYEVLYIVFRLRCYYNRPLVLIDSVNNIIILAKCRLYVSWLYNIMKQIKK